MSNDRLSNMLSSLKNASMAGKNFVELPHTKECEGVANVLKDAGYLTEVKTFKEKGSSFKSLRLDLDPSLTQTVRVSKPGQRIYSSAAHLSRVSKGIGVLVVSTSKGILSGSEARKRKLGGEVLCEVF